MREAVDSVDVDRLGSALESAMDGMAILDSDERFVYVNQAHAELYGYDDPSALVGETWRCLYEQDQIDRIETEVLARLEENGQWRGSAVGRRRNGQTFRQELSLSRTDVGGIICTVRDVSERAERRRVLERQETILQSIRDGVYTLDPDGHITWVNEAAVDEFDAGYSRDDLVGAHVSMLMSDADIQRCADIIEELLAEGGPETGRCEIAIQTAYGDEIPCELQMTLLPLQDGEFQGTVGVVRDVSDRRRREQQLSVLNRVLRHNLRNRMTVLLGQLEFLEPHVDDPGLDRFETVRETAEALGELGEKGGHIEDIIEGDLERPSTVDVVEIVRASAESFRERHPEASISVDAPPSQRAKANERLGTAIDALVENAIEHADRTPRVSITVEPPEEDGWMRIAVADNGPGIPEPEIEILSEDREGPLSHGSGLGLWTVRWYVDSHGGNLSFDENEPRGTVATIHLRPA